MSKNYDFGFGVSVVIAPGVDEHSCNIAEIKNSEARL
jgi:hypothetical protein